MINYSNIKHFLCLISMLIPLLTSCQNQGRNQDKKRPLAMHDIEIFENTPAWDLVLAVDDDKASKVKSILKNNKNIVNYQEPFYGTTCLMWAIHSRKYKAAQALLENGANPDIVSKYGYPALFMAIDFGWYDTKFDEDAKYVKLLLKYKANPNLVYSIPPKIGESTTDFGTSPLIYAVAKGFDKVKLLVEAGADVNHTTKTKVTATVNALLMKDVKTAYYLIVEKKADITKPYYYYALSDTTLVLDDPRHPVDLLLEWDFELNSPEHQLKKKIIEEFVRQGITDYQERKKTKLYSGTLDKFKKLYPNNWEEYLEKY